MNPPSKNRPVYVARNLALFLLAALLLGVGGAVAGLARQGAMGYIHPQRVPVAPGDNPARFGVPYEELRLTTTDGITLAAWYTPPLNGVVVLSAHGYPGHRVASVHAMFAQHGYGVLSWDMRALGESGGDTSTLGYFEVLDAQAALEYALAQPGVQQVVGYGQSMGAVTLIRAAARESRIAAVIADSPFYSLEAMIERQLTTPVIGQLVRFFAEWEAGIDAAEVSPLADIGKIAPRPVFIIQGEQDNYIPPDSAGRLYAAAGEPRQVWLVPGAVHVGAFDLVHEEYEQRVMAFLDHALGQP